MAENNKKKSGLILSCWIVAALILLIAFLVNGNTIISNLKSTGFFERIFGTTPEFIKNHKDETPPKSNGLLDVEIEKPEIPAAPDGSSAPKTEPVPDTTAPDKIDESLTKQNIEKQTPEETAAIPQKTDTEKTEVTAKPADTKPAPVPAPKAINLTICFVLIDTDGSINRKEIVRQSVRRDAPLSAAIEILLEGPTVSERNNKYMSLIPSGTRLLGASVKNGVATLNFSEEFEFNTYGVEGYLGQLMQIVYTATAFSTVDSVQFLIDGQKKEYLGSEGVWIGSPLARSTFK